MTTTADTTRRADQIETIHDGKHARHETPRLDWIEPTTIYTKPNQTRPVIRYDFGALDSWLDRTRAEHAAHRTADITRYAYGADTLGIGIANLDDLYSRIRDGRPADAMGALFAAAAETTRDELARLAPTVTTRRRRRITDAGDEIELDRWLAGESEHWIDRRPGAALGFGTVRLGLNIAAVAEIGPENFAQAAATIAAIADAITAAGWSTEILGFGASRQVDRKFRRTYDMPEATTFTVKNAGEPFDAGRVLALGAAGAFRIVNAIARDAATPKYAGDSPSRWGSRRSCGHQDTDALCAALELDTLAGAQIPELADALAVLRRRRPDILPD